MTTSSSSNTNKNEEHEIKPQHEHEQGPIRRQVHRKRPGMYLVITNISKRTNIKSLLKEAVAFQCKEILVVGQKNFNFTIISESSSQKLEEQDQQQQSVQREQEESHKPVTTTDIPRSIHPVIIDGILPIVRFDRWDDCITYLKERNVRIVGVEIHGESKLIDDVLLYDSNDNYNYNDPKMNEISIRDTDHTDTTNNYYTSSNYHDTAFIMGNEGTGMNKKHMDSCDLFVRIPQYGAGTASLNVAVAASIILYKFHYYQREYDELFPIS